MGIFGYNYTIIHTFIIHNTLDHMNFSKNDIEKLPTIIELVNNLRIEELKACQKELWLPAIDEYHNPLIALKNKARNDQFIVSGLASGRFSLKPNLTNSRILYRGQNTYFEPCNPTLFRENKELYIIENLKVDEFRILVRSHPLSMMFERGINLLDRASPFFFEMNYYGLAQHYDFKTGLLDFTSDIEVAAFFATSYRSEDGRYHPIKNDNEVGVLYAHEIDNTSFLLNNFRTIGLQIFPRSGSQKGFLYQTSRNHNINNNQTIKKHFFKQSKVASQFYYDKMDNGNYLFPKDELGDIAKKIINDKEISLIALSDGCLFNKDKELYKTLETIRELGYNIDPTRKIIFTESDLNNYYENIRNGSWEQFCDKVYFAGEDGNKLKEALLKLPNHNTYIQYFNKKYFNKISMFNQFNN